MSAPYPDTYRERAVERYETTNLSSAQIADWMAKSHPELPAPPAGTIRMWTTIRRKESGSARPAARAAAPLPTLPHEDCTPFYKRMERAERKTGKAYVDAVERVMRAWTPPA